MARKLLTCTSAAIIALCVGLPGMAPSADAAAPPETPATLELDTRLLDHEVGLRIEAELAEQLGPQLETLSQAVVADPAMAPTIIRIRVIAFDAEQRDYDVEIQQISPGVEPVGDTLYCRACNEQRLVSRIVEDTSGLLESARPLPPPPRLPSAPAPVPVPVPPIGPIGPIGFVGAALGTAGIAIGAIGIYGVTRGLVTEPSEGPTITTRNYVPVGTAATAVGAASLIVGAALVAVDVRRRWSSNRRVAFHTSPSHVGIQIEQRF